VHRFVNLAQLLGMMAGLALLRGCSYLFNYRHQPALIDELDDVLAEPLMGQARGIYTFGEHLRWTWAVLLGFVASIGVQLATRNILHVWRP
jgi:hypothetical protein